MGSVMRFDYKCAKCTLRLTPPVYQCYSGHLLCDNCSSLITTCPACCEPLPGPRRIRSIELEKIITQLQDHECPHPQCGAIVKFEELQEHWLDCSKAFLPFCGMMSLRDCKIGVNVDELVNHFQNDHTGFLLCKPRFGQKVTLKMWTPGKLAEAPHDHVLLFQIERLLFVLHITYNDGHMTWTPWVIGGSRTAERYSYAVTLGDSQDPQMTWKGRVFHLMSTHEELEAGFSTRIATVLDRMKDNRGAYLANITFFEYPEDGFWTTCARKIRKCFAIEQPAGMKSCFRDKEKNCEESTAENSESPTTSHTPKAPDPEVTVKEDRKKQFRTRPSIVESLDIEWSNDIQIRGFAKSLENSLCPLDWSF